MRFGVRVGCAQHYITSWSFVGDNQVPQVLQLNTCFVFVKLTFQVLNFFGADIRCLCCNTLGKKV